MQPSLSARARLHSASGRPCKGSGLARRSGCAALRRGLARSLVIRRRTHVNVHRVRETINGREYLIEVSSVGSDKWRAQIARAPGGSAALMPFYGKTPGEAAGQLSHWLALAHGIKRC
jgi:hypothetical protein